MLRISSRNTGSKFIKISSSASGSSFAKVSSVKQPTFEVTSVDFDSNPTTFNIQVTKMDNRDIFSYDFKLIFYEYEYFFQEPKNVGVETDLTHNVNIPEDHNTITDTIDDPHDFTFDVSDITLEESKSIAVNDSLTSVIQTTIETSEAFTGDIQSTTSNFKGFKGSITDENAIPGSFSVQRIGSTSENELITTFFTTFSVIIDRVELKNPIESQQFVVNMKNIQVGNSIHFSIQMETNQSTHYSLLYKPITSSNFISAITIPEQDFENKTINGQNTKLYVKRYVN